MADTRIQLCGPLVARVAGERVDGRLPGRQGRLLFAHLVLGRRTVTAREALVDLLWGEAPPEAADAALSSLLSKLRRIVPVEGRSEPRLAAMHIGGGELATAERAAERLVEPVPLRESGTRLLMEIHSMRGNRAEALLAYEALRQRLRDELGVGPPAETVAAHRRLLT